MDRHYSQDDLKGIGRLCKTRLPPASAVQAMFLYEMQRETEVERLFQGQMFRLAKADDESRTQEQRVSDLEEQVKALQKRVTAKEVDERLATSKVRMNAQQAKLNLHEQSLDSHSKRIIEVEEKLRASAAARNSTREDLIDLSSVAADHSDEPATTAQVKTGLVAANEDISVLFDERDALAHLLNEANLRIDKLEDLVRALTRQNSNSGSNSSSNHSSPQLLPVRSSDGQALDLSVPKGNPLVPANRENQAPIRTFTPGKQWMT